MNEELHTYIEPELEARITALVLGEASEFEVDELERLIEEKPELQIFRRRIQAMHDLLGEAIKPEPDAQWLLSSDRRAALRNTFSRNVEPAPKGRSRRKSSRKWQAVIAVAACLLICLVLFSVTAPLSKTGDYISYASEIVTYSASKEAPEEDLFAQSSSSRSSGMVKLKTELPREVIEGSPSPLTVPEKTPNSRRSAKKSIADNQHGVPNLADIPATGRLFESESQVTRGVDRKPSIPSSGMAKVIAANTTSPAKIPVPDVNMPDPSVAFGNGDDFGDGWGSGSGADDPFGASDGDETLARNSSSNLDGVVRRELPLKPSRSLAETNITIAGQVIAGKQKAEKSGESYKWKKSSDLGRQIVKGEAKDKNGSIVDRLAEVEEMRKGLDPASRSESLSARKGSKQKALGLEGGMHLADGTYAYRAGKKEGERSFIAGGAVEEDKKRDASGFINPVDAPVILSVTGGLRSGDFETTQASIDAILNDPSYGASGKKDFSSKMQLGSERTDSKGKDRFATYTGTSLGDSTYSSSNFVGYVQDEEFLHGDAGITSSFETRNTGGGLYDIAANDDAKEKSPLKWNAGISYGLDDSLATPSPRGQITNRKEPSSIAQKEMARRGATVVDADKALLKGRKAYSKGDKEEAIKQYRIAKNLLPPGPALADRRQSIERHLGDANKAIAATQAQKPVPKPSLVARPASPPMAKEEGKLRSIKSELQNKSNRVAELRKSLMDQAEKVGLIYVETEKGGETMGNTLGLRDQAEKELYEAKREKEQLSFQINKLLSVEDDDLISVASELPDVGFKETYGKYEDAKSELATLKASGLSNKHPDIKARETRIKDIEKNLEKRALNVRESLKHRLALVDGRIQKMNSVVNGLQDEGTEKARSIQEFNVARKEYQKALNEKDQLEVRYDIEKTKTVLPSTNLQAKKPQRRGRATIASPITPKALPDETTTATTPFSTFSLNVADVSFKLAKAALLEKGQWPDAAKVRTEEFVNAFDYGDPSPRRGEPVACAIEQSAHPFFQQRNLLRVGMKTASIGRSAPLRLTVLLDNSGSMEREDREASVLAAIQVLAAQLGPQDVITLVGFARQPRLLADRISGDKADQLVRIVASTPSEGGTNLEEALRLARTLAKRQHTEGAQDRVVLITDGVANLGNTVPEELSREIETMRQEGIAFDACGVGAEGLNDDILEALTRKGDGRYYFLNRAEDADSGFAKQLAGALTPAAKNVKVQVKFNPKRVTRYRLLGFEKHRLKKEDFRNDKVDAAEMAAEEAGNAVYQIQVNPDGEGEVGEVFVRFLDTSTGRMVERSWPLPYEPQAQAFDLATPSMQLAGTAAMLGEKLHGTDAGSVRFPMISNTLGKLRGHYASDPKVQDLIRMCEKVK